LSNAIANKSFKLRFRIATDEAAGETGWDIDEISVQGATNTPFPSIVANATSCAGLPTADAGPDATVAIGDTVKLDGSKSKDPDGDPLTFEWSQVDGPTVTLDKPQTVAPSFVAPSVTAATPITLKLKVSDGKGWASDTVVITVDPNEKPGGPGPVLSDGGCGCVTVGSGPTNSVAAFSLLGFIGLAVGRLRRRRS